MTFDEAKQILNLFSIAYPHYYKDFSQDQKRGIVQLWANAFKDINGVIVLKAVEDHVMHSKDKFPPMPGEILDRIIMANRGNYEEEALDGWDMVKRYMRCMNWDRSDYERYTLLPDEIKRVYSYSDLEQMAQRSSMDNDTYEKPRFMKFYQSMAKDRDQKMISSGRINELIEMNKQREEERSISYRWVKADGTVKIVYKDGTTKVLGIEHDGRTDERTD